MKRVPKLKNEKLEDAKKILDELKINYNEDIEKEYSLRVRRGRVIRTEPEENEELKMGGKITLYVSKLCLLPFFLILFILILLMFINIGISSLYTNNKPIIERTNEGWVKKDIVYVKKDVDIDRLDYYMYCVTTDKTSKKCDWKDTKTKNTELSKTGKWNVFFKAKYKDGKYSLISNKVEVLIDNDAPIIDNITKNIKSNSLMFNVKAQDKGSGIKSYSYKINGDEYKEVKNNFTIKGLKSNTEYTITVKVEDNAGNIYEVTFKETTTKNDSDNNSSDTNNSNSNNNTNDTNNSNNNNNNNNGNNGNNGDDKNSTATTTTKKINDSEIEIPKIDLEDLPSSFTYGEDYSLPSYVEFGPSGGEYSCALDHNWSQNITTTSEIFVGKHNISCRAISNTGTTAYVSKDINIKIASGEDEEFDGWIKMNLYYPEGSTNWEWRLHREGEIRGKDDDWQSYVGPILVKITDVENIYIRYDLNGEKVIQVPTNKVLVDINANKLSLKSDETTNVSITYDKNATTKEYRINGGAWIKYTKEFNVGSDTLVEARAIKNENVYDNEGNVFMQKTLIGTDSVYISERGESTLNFGTVNIKIQPEKKELNNNDTTSVSIEYEEDSYNRMYKIDNGPWILYTNSFQVKANSTIYAIAEANRSITLENGTKKSGIAKGNASLTISSNINDQDVNSLFVNIVASPNRVLMDEQSTISIKSNEANAKIYYSLDDSNYIEYKGPFNIGANTRIYAKAEYENKFAYDTIYIDTVKIADYLDGPIINVNPTTITENINVTITTLEKAKHIYYSINNGNYKEYSKPFTFNKNAIISSYYISEDNRKSDITYYYVQNIKVNNKPYVRIDATPNTYLSTNTDRVEVNISGENYDTLEYSYNNIEYFAYEHPLVITESQRIYAKGTNKYGETIEKLDITTLIPPKVPQKLDVAITLSPEEKDIEGLINKLEVSIDYDIKATKKYYQLGGGELKEYNGPFELTENTTIHAYAISDNGEGSTSKQVNYLTTGISSPIINVNPYIPSTYVKVEIDYAKNANIKRYKLNNGSWLDYIGPIEINTNNTTIYAYNEDILGNHQESSKLISNIIPKENITIVEYDNYYRIKLNYPENSKKEDREYKWKNDGTWKQYDDKGIFLIKKSSSDKIDPDKGIKVEDEFGNTMIIKDHFYVLDVPLSELSENLFMRWETELPSPPEIILSTYDWTKELTVAINYDKSLTNKLYKVVYEDGTDTGWQTYEKPIKININNATIYAKGSNKFEYQSEVISKKITNIDEISPTIELKGEFESPRRQVLVNVFAKDNGRVEAIKYAKGNHDSEYFSDNGKLTQGSFIITENGEYTVYAIDSVGNTTVKTIEINNIDTLAPNIIINVLTENYGTEAEINIDYGDSVKKEYKIGENASTYQNYTNNLKLKSNDVLDLVNNDGSLTITARGTDEAGNISEVSEKIYILDLDAPNQPEIIHTSNGYPILTEYGVKLGTDSYIIFDNRDDIDNYYSTDNGNTWQVYKGPFETTQTIMAKSVKKESGLTVTSTKTLTTPSDALGVKAYDGNENTYESWGYNSTRTTVRKIKVSKEMQGKNIYVKQNVDTGNGQSFYKYINKENKEIKTYSFPSSFRDEEYILTIPEGTAEIQMISSTDYAHNMTIYEIRPSNPIQKSLELEEEIPNPIITIDITEQSVAKNITISYPSGYTNEYSLDLGNTWIKYTEPIIIKENQIVIARVISEDNTLSSSSFTITKIEEEQN